jgi:hypothetical protein
LIFVLFFTPNAYTATPAEQKIAKEIASLKSPNPWRRLARADLTRIFAEVENCFLLPDVKVIAIESRRRSDGVLRETERWVVSGCGKQKEWVVIFNPDIGSGLTYYLDPPDDSEPVTTKNNE